MLRSEAGVVCTNLTPGDAREETEKHDLGERDFGELNELLHFLSIIQLNYWEMPHALFYWDRCVGRKGGRLRIFFSFGFMSFIDFSRRKGLLFDPVPPAWDKNCWQLPRD